MMQSELRVLSLEEITVISCGRRDAFLLLAAAASVGTITWTLVITSYLNYKYRKENESDQKIQNFA